jgi:hypothetical protein
VMPHSVETYTHHTPQTFHLGGSCPIRLGTIYKRTIRLRPARNLKLVYPTPQGRLRGASHGYSTHERSFLSHLSESSVPHTTPSGMPIDGSLMCFTSQGILSLGYAPSYQHDPHWSTHLRYGAFDSPMRCKAAVEALSVQGLTPSLVQHERPLSGRMGLPVHACSHCLGTDS